MDPSGISSSVVYKSGRRSNNIYWNTINSLTRQRGVGYQVTQCSVLIVSRVQGPSGMGFYHYKGEEPFDNFLLAAVLGPGYDESCRPVLLSPVSPGRAEPCQSSSQLIW